MNTTKLKFLSIGVAMLAIISSTCTLRATGGDAGSVTAGTAVLPSLQPTVMSTNYVPTGNTFLDQFGQFFSQPDRGLGTWTSTNGAPKTADVYVGACFENSVNADGIIGGDYRVYKNVVVDFFGRIFNSSQTMKSFGAGPGFELPVGDLKIGAYLDLVYRLDDHCMAVEPKIALKNGIGKNTYLQTALATDYEIKAHSAQKPFLSTCFGFNF